MSANTRHAHGGYICEGSSTANLVKREREPLHYPPTSSCDCRSQSAAGLILLPIERRQTATSTCACVHHTCDNTPINTYNNNPTCIECRQPATQHHHAAPISRRLTPRPTTTTAHHILPHASPCTQTPKSSLSTRLLAKQRLFTPAATAIHTTTPVPSPLAATRTRRLLGDH